LANKLDKIKREKQKKLKKLHTNKPADTKKACIPYAKAEKLTKNRKY
jgi:hypothetical protein